VQRTNKKPDVFDLIASMTDRYAFGFEREGINPFPTFCDLNLYV